MSSKVIVGMTLSLDGFVNDRNGDVGRLYADLAEMQETPSLLEAIHDTGAVVMGRRAYEMGNGDYTGYEFQVPIFVITHDPPESAAQGENDKLRFHFVTAGVESAIQQAQEAADGKDVVVVGGPSVAQQLLKAGLVDELHIDIVPLLLGQGLRLFENLAEQAIQLEKTRLNEVLGRTQLRFRVIKLRGKEQA